MIVKVTSSENDQQEFRSLDIDPAILQDDFCDYTQVVVKKPWGYEYLIFSNDSVAVWILYLKKGAKTSMHCHPGKKTSLVVLSGEVVCHTLNGSWNRKAGEGMLIDKVVFHQTESLSESGAFVMEIETPVNKRDLVRLKDEYGREGKGYEDVSSHSMNLQNYNYLSLEGPEVYHNTKKSFGECSLKFMVLENQKSFDDIFVKGLGDVYSILNGKLFNRSDDSVFEVGDTFPQSVLESHTLQIEGPIEILAISKRDPVSKVSDIVADFFADNELESVFLVPGDSNLHLLDSIGRHEKLSFMVSATAQGAAFAAEGYAKLSHKLTPVVFPTAAASLSAISAIANAWVDSTPIIFITGQARSDQCDDGNTRQLGNKALNLVAMLESITKYSARIIKAEEILFELTKAVKIATSGRPGPVFIELPIDIQGATIEQEKLKSFSLKDLDCLDSFSSPSDSLILEVLQALESAERPVFLVGGGIHLASAEEDLRELLSKLNIPVLASRRGVDLLPDDLNLFFGRPGMYGQRKSNIILQNADLLLSVGSRLSIPMIGRVTGNFARDAKKIVVDIDSAELKKSTLSIDLPINCDAKEFLKALNSKLCTQKSYKSWNQYCTDISERFGDGFEEYKHENNKISPYLFLENLSKILPSNAVFVIDGGMINYYVMQVFKVKAGQRIISSTGLDETGFAVSAAIGIAAVERDRPVVCLCNDRGLLLSQRELATATNYKLPLTIFVLQTNGHATLRMIQKDYFGGRFVGTDTVFSEKYSRLAIDSSKSLGYSYSLLDSPENMRSNLSLVDFENGPSLIEIVSNSEQELIPRTSFIARDDGKWIARPLEDMYPFLERETLKELMIVDQVAED